MWAAMIDISAQLAVAAKEWASVFNGDAILATIYVRAPLRMATRDALRTLGAGLDGVQTVELFDCDGEVVRAG